MNTFHQIVTRWAVLACLLLAAPLAFAEPIEQARLDAIGKDLQVRIDNGKLAGAVAMAAKDGEVQMLEAYGYRDLDKEEPMTTDTIFRIFSMTKPIVGTALMTLHDQGKFKLDEPVEKYIPEFKDIGVFKAVNEDGSFETVPADHPMTIQELMTHTGGLVYVPPLSRGPVAKAYAEAGILDRDITLSEMADKLGNIPLNHQPGTRWVYSVSVDVQGYLVEVLSGQPLDQYLKETIFEPLGMKDTGFYVPEEKADRLSRQYGPKEGGLVATDTGQFLEKPELFSGGGGLVSTASDYMKFAQMHVNEGVYNDERILSEDAIEIMRTNLLPEGVENIGAFYPGNVFGVDFAIVNDSEAADGLPEGTHWWWGIAGTWFWIDPVNDIVFIGMIQNDDLMYSRQVHSKSRQLIYQ